MSAAAFEAAQRAAKHDEFERWRRSEWTSWAIRDADLRGLSNEECFNLTRLDAVVSEKMKLDGALPPGVMLIDYHGDTDFDTAAGEPTEMEKLAAAEIESRRLLAEVP